MRHELVYHVSRRKAGLVLLAALALVAMGGGLLERRPLIGWASVILFGLGAAGALVAMLPGVLELRLDPEGFELRTMGRRRRTSWREVRAFRIASIRGARMIAIEYEPGYSGRAAGRAATAAISGVEAAIPDRYDVSLPELERTLNEWRDRYGPPAPDGAGARTGSPFDAGGGG